MPYILREQPGRFVPPASLEAHFKQYVNEHAAVRGLGQTWAETVTVWRIENAAAEECGYAWWLPAPEDPCARVVTIAVFDAHAWHGAGSYALSFLEAEARRTGVTSLRAQVNNNEPETGLRVRRWLLGRRFELSKDSMAHHDKSALWRRVPLREYIERCSYPMFFRKAICPDP